MERLEYDRYGGPDLVHLSSFTLPNPTSNELVVRVAAASINPVDWKVRRGDLKLITGFKFPRAMGTDFSGVVEAVGPGVSHFRAGDAVVGAVSLKVSGAFAPKVIALQKSLVKKPNSLSFAEAASLPVAGVTAWLALVKYAHLNQGQRVFINGAMGAVGQACVTIARGIGADVVGRVGPRSIAQAQSLGVSFALNYTEALPPSLHDCFDAVIDCNGSLTAQQENQLIKRGGKIIDTVPSRQKFFRALFARSRTLIFANPKAENLQSVVDLAAAGKLAIRIAKTISMAEAPALLAALERGERLDGKAVIEFRTSPPP